MDLQKITRQTCPDFFIHHITLLIYPGTCPVPRTTSSGTWYIDNLGKTDKIFKILEAGPGILLALDFQFGAPQKRMWGKQKTTVFGE